MASAVALTMKPARTEGLNSTPMAEGPEAATQTFIAGAPLKTNGSGFLAVIAADDTALIVGIAAEDGHNDAAAGDTQVKYYPALPGMVFEITLEDAGTEGHVSVDGNLFEDYALQTDSDKFYLDENDTTNVAMVIVGFKDAVGTTEARVFAKFLSSVTLW